MLTHPCSKASIMRMCESIHYPFEDGMKNLSVMGDNRTGKRQDIEKKGDE